MLLVLSLILFASVSTIGSEEVTILPTFSTAVEPPTTPSGELVTLASSTADPPFVTTTQDPFDSSEEGSGICRVVGQMRLACYRTDLRDFNGTGTDLESIRHIRLANPPSKNLTKDDFNKFPMLKILMVSDSKITSIEPSTFSKSPELLTIQFDGELTAIPPAVFNNTNITMVEIDNNGITLNIPKNERFLIANNLTILSFQKCNLNEIYAESFLLPKLSQLSITESEDAQLTISPKMLEKTNVSSLSIANVELIITENKPFLTSQTLQSLKLENVKIKTFHDEIFQDLPRLDALTIKLKNITTIKMPSNLVDKTNISRLHISNVMFSENESIFKSQILKQLALKNSGIKALTYKNFYELPNLEDLTLWEEKLSLLDLNKDIFSSTKITSLKLRNLSIKHSGNESFLISENLKELIIENQGIQTITDAFLEGTPNLEKLTISENNDESPSSEKENSESAKITLSSNFLNNAKVKYLILLHLPIAIEENKPILVSALLSELHIRNAKLQALYQDTFSLLPQLEKLYLNNNQLQRLPAGIFEKNKKLKHLDIRKNKFKTLDLNVFGDDMQYRRVYIYGQENPWVCDCALFPLMQLSVKTLGHRQPDCETPESNVEPIRFDGWLEASAILRSKCNQIKKPEIAKN